MDLIISEQEYNSAAEQLTDTAEELLSVADAYVICLQSVKSLGYKSAASAVAIDNRCAKIQKAMEAFGQSLEGIPKNTERHLGTIASIDRLVF